MDTFPEAIEPYCQTREKQLKSLEDEAIKKVADHINQADTVQVIPRYLRRAIWSQDKRKINKAVERALKSGWTVSEIRKQCERLNFS